MSLAATAHAIATRSAAMAQAVAAGELRVVPAYYDLDTGQVDFL